MDRAPTIQSRRRKTRSSVARILAALISSSALSLSAQELTILEFPTSQVAGPIGDSDDLTPIMMPQAMSANSGSLERVDAACEKCDPVADSWSHQPAMVGCADCHFAGPRENPLAKSRKQDEFSRQNELRIWLEKDKHAVARQRVEPYTQKELELISSCLKSKYGFDTSQIRHWIGPSNRLSQTICDNLDYDIATPAGYLKFRDHCLTCHGGYEYDASSKRKQIGFTSRDEYRQAGLSCQFCHQHENGQDDWIDKHRSPTNWRLRPPNEKEDDGMRNLVPHTAQALLCNDCHVGNIPQHRFITHKMFAAGHPPLPPFELDTFCSAMPQHWRTPSELFDSFKDAADRQKYFAAYYSGLFSEADSATSADNIAWRTRRLLTGAIQTRKHNLKLLSDAAASGLWGDYALYDCSACHHELRTTSQRQSRGFPGKPGRPRELMWPRVVLDQALHETNTADAFANLQSELDFAMSAQPFGNAEQVSLIADRAIASLSMSQGQLDRILFDRSRARKVLAGLLSTNRQTLIEHESARNLVWAVNRVARDLAESNDARDVKTLQSVIDLENSRVGDLLQINLPAGQSEYIYKEYLKSELQRRATFLDGEPGATGPDLLENNLLEIRKTIVPYSGAPQVYLKPDDSKNFVESFDLSTGR